MREYPILFSPLMVRALLANQKFVTRRLSPRWMKVKRGDRLWVKEGWQPSPVGCTTVAVKYLADGSICNFAGDEIPAAWKPPKAAERGGVTSLFMPRWASRILLEAEEDTRAERLWEITEEDARLEGVEPCCGGTRFRSYGEAPHAAINHYADPRASFETLWQSLHTKLGERWEDNPTVYRVGRFHRTEGRA